MEPLRKLDVDKLTDEDIIYLNNVMVDIQSYIAVLDSLQFKKKVLLFPPVNSFRRYLIHYIVHTTFEKNNLDTISIGSLYARRTVVYPSCLKSLESSIKINRNLSITKAPEQRLYRPPAMRRSIENSSSAANDRKSKKPDRQFYVPRGRRIPINQGYRDSEQIDAHASCDQVSPMRRSSITNSHDRSTIDDMKLSSNELVGKNPKLSTSKKFPLVSFVRSQENLRSQTASTLNSEEKEIDKSISEYNNQFESCSVVGRNVISYSSVDRKNPLISFVQSQDNAQLKTTNVFSSEEKVVVRVPTTISMEEDQSNASISLENDITFESRNDQKFEISDELSQDEDIKLLQEDTKIVLSDRKSSRVQNEDIVIIREEDIKFILPNKLTIPSQKNQSNSNNSSSEMEDKTIVDLTCDDDSDEADDLNVLSKNEKLNREQSLNSSSSIDEISNSGKNVWKSTDVSESSIKKKTDSLKVDDCDWENLFDDDGEYVDKSLINELMTEIGKVTIQRASQDYTPFQTVEERTSDGDCIIEIFGFSSDLKTDDLVAVLAAYRVDPAFQIIWVDDTHALAIFSSPTVADEVLNTELLHVKTRPLKNAIPKSRMKAKNFILPPATRPKTCVSLARRLVSGHLGMKINVTREQREAERRLLSDARENRRRIAKQKQDAWEGSSNS